MESLNEQQRKLVEKNHNLIYGYCNKYGLDVDEYYCVCAYALCKVAAAYDGSTAFSTLAYKAFENEIRHEYRQSNMQKRKGETVSMETVKCQYDGKAITLEDTLSDKKIYSLESETKLIFHKWLETLSERERKIVLLKFEGLNMKEIGDRLGISRTTVCETIKKQRYKFSLAIGK